MKVVWHIGPHKTGTTSVQQALLDRYQAGAAGYHYPECGAHGPGHAELAWRFFGMRDFEHRPRAVVDLVAAAEKEGARSVVLSSEEFSRAVLTEEGFTSFRTVSDRFPCELVVTISPLRSRLYAELQEAMKFGTSFSLFDLEELLAFMSERPGLRPDFLPRAIAESGTQSATVVYTDKRDPQRAFTSFSSILGEEFSPSQLSVNASLPYLKAAWLNELNRNLTGTTWQQARAIVDAAFDAAREVEPRVLEPQYPPLPDAFARHIDEMWAAQVELVSILEASGRLRSL